MLCGILRIFKHSFGSKLLNFLNCFCVLMCMRIKGYCQVFYCLFHFKIFLCTKYIGIYQRNSLYELKNCVIYTSNIQSIIFSVDRFSV
jgi:hypothetical protein